MKLEFVPDVRQCWRWLSMQIPALNLAFLATWAMLPERFQNAIPERWVLVIAVVLIAAGMFGRLVKQRPGSGDRLENF